MRVFVLLFICLALSACAGRDRQETLSAGLRGDRLAGLALAERQCAACHAVGATGESTFEGAPAFRRLGEKYPPGALAEAFAEGVIVGHPAMPEFALEPEQIDDLVAYLEWIQAGGATPYQGRNPTTSAPRT